MSDKYTLRDFFAYFFTGFYLICSIVIIYFQTISENVSTIKEIKELIIFIIIPLCYVLGHTIHAIDNFIDKIGEIIRKCKSNNKFVKLLNKIVNGCRQVGVQKEIWVCKEEFLLICSKLQNKGFYGKAEYYQVMNDMFKGFLIVSIISAILATIMLEYCLFFIFLFTVLLFWYRARRFAFNYVRTFMNQKQLLDS